MAYLYWYIRDFFILCGKVIIFIIALIGALIDMLVKAVSFLVSLIGSLPVFLTVSAGALIVVCVLYKILGRESSS